MDIACILNITINNLDQETPRQMLIANYINSKVVLLLISLFFSDFKYRSNHKVRIFFCSYTLNIDLSNLRYCSTATAMLRPENEQRERRLVERTLRWTGD